MPRNVEIKARLLDRQATEQAVLAIATSEPRELVQDDAFFNCPSGRLKLRTDGTNSGELIFYRRADMPGPKLSDYIRVTTTDANALREVLTTALGSAGRVQKVRTLYLAGRTRIHLDRVKDLGDFIELEIVLADGEPAESGENEARELLRKLRVGEQELVPVAYLDLLARAARLKLEA